jgi:multidrug resistance protein, MATE family
MYRNSLLPEFPTCPFEAFMTSETNGNHPAGSVRELIHVALPLVISSGSLSLMHVVDRIFLTWYSPNALAAALPAGILNWTAISVAMGTGLYANTFVAQYEGAGRKDRVAAAIWQGIYLSLLSGAILLVLVPLSTRIFAVIGHDAAIQEMEAKYFAICCFGAAPMILAAVLSCFFSGRGYTKIVMWVNIVGASVNIILDYLFIFGPGPFPRWGIEGAAMATVVANVVNVALYVVLIVRQPAAQEYAFWGNRRFDATLFRRFVRYGLPNGLQFFTDVLAFALFILLLGKLGTASLTASNLAFNVNALAFVPLLGIGTAVMILVGRRIGEGRPELAVRTTWLAFALSGSGMVLFAGLYLFLPKLILAPYAMFAEVGSLDQIQDQVVILLRFVALYGVFDAMAIIFGSAVRGAGDTRFSLVYSCVTGWLVMVLPTFAIWRWYGGSLIASWSACTAYIFVLGIGLMIRFHTGKWKSMQVIEPDVTTEDDPTRTTVSENDSSD